MGEGKEIRGQFKYEKDSKRYHRFNIESKEGIVGNLYIPKDKAIPDRIILDNAKKA